MRKANVLLLIMALALSIGTLGCGEGDSATSTDVTTPNPGTLVPTGTIQGRLTDAVTQQPIVGAVIDIGVSQGTTNSDGQFVIFNVPASWDALNNSVQGSYRVTINMKNVTSPVVQSSATTAKYSDYYFKDIAVRYTSLNDTDGTNAGTGSGTNHDTPVTGLVADADFTVGKMAATIRGVVAGCRGSAFFTPVGAGYTVRLATSGGSDNATSGFDGNVVATATTDANGAFTFANVESFKSFWICAVDANNTMYGCADGNPATAPTGTSLFRPNETNMEAVTTPADGVTTQLAIQNSNAVHVCSTDIHGPGVTLVTPEPGSDLAPSSTQQVKFKFSEPVLLTATTSTLASAVGNLYDKIEVSYAGAKAGNLSYKLNWNAAMDELTVEFATAASGKYYVRIANMTAADFITDANNNAAVMGKCPDDLTAQTAFVTGITADANADDCTAYFTTNGGPTAAAPVILLTNSASLDNTAVVGDGRPSLDWLPASGANGGYTVYRRQNQEFGGTVQSGPTVSIAHTANTFFAETADLAFNSGPYKLSYDYIVRSVNSDGVESGDSNPQNASDKVGPDFGNCTCNAGAAGVGTLVLNTWNEPLDEASATTATNFVSSVDAVASATYNSAANTITLRFSGALACPTTTTLTVTGVKDVSGNNNLTTPANTNTCTY